MKAALLKLQRDRGDQTLWHLLAFWTGATRIGPDGPGALDYDGGQGLQLVVYEVDSQQAGTCMHTVKASTCFNLLKVGAPCMQGPLEELANALDFAAQNRVGFGFA